MASFSIDRRPACYFVCLYVSVYVCPHTKRETPRTINAKRGTRILNGRTSALLGSKLQKVKGQVTRLQKPLRCTVIVCSRCRRGTARRMTAQVYSLYMKVSWWTCVCVCVCVGGVCCSGRLCRHRRDVRHVVQAHVVRRGHRLSTAWRHLATHVSTWSLARRIRQLFRR